LFQFRLKPYLVGMKGSMTISHSPQFIEHGGNVARHADLGGLGVVGLRPLHGALDVDKKGRTARMHPAGVCRSARRIDQPPPLPSR
jgi:hypothetical protein